PTASLTLVLRGLGDRPVIAVLVGAVAIAFSGIFFRLAHVSPSTGAFYRCVWALLPLWVLARTEDRRFGRRPLRARLLAWLAGISAAWRARSSTRPSPPHSAAPQSGRSSAIST